MLDPLEGVLPVLQISGITRLNRLFEPPRAGFGGAEPDEACRRRRHSTVKILLSDQPPLAALTTVDSRVPGAGTAEAGAAATSS